ncbi:MAG: aminotransferase class V-fold PLP-dependent enzyme [Thermoplasmata archaeon]
MDVKKIREDFPIFRKMINGKRIVYLDSTATTQKPYQVIEKIKEFYENYNANVHRGIYSLSEYSTELYEKSRENVAGFINAHPEEIVFVRNTTEGLNLLSYSFLWNFLKPGDKILISMMEHHSNFIPWVRLKHFNIDVDFINITEEGYLDLEDLKNKLDKRTKIVSLSHVSNVLGTINDVNEISKIVHDNNSIFVVDGAQSVPHTPVDVKKIDCDFIAFSGHKMLGPMGIGVLYGKYDILKEMAPFLSGGEMIKEVHIDNIIYEDPPLKFEAGTPNVEGSLGLSAAIDYLKNIGMENVRDHEKRLTDYALKKMDEFDDIVIYGPKNVEKRGGVISFNFNNGNRYIEKELIKNDIFVHPHDVASILDTENVMVRSGHHCAEPLMDFYRIPATTRASFYIYNDEEDVDILMDGIKKVRKVMKIG